LGHALEAGEAVVQPVRRYEAALAARGAIYFDSVRCLKVFQSDGIPGAEDDALVRHGENIR
jgi:hypothetical protein